MQVATLRHRVTFQEKTTTSDGMGGNTVVWTDVTECWAAIWPMNSKERIENAKLESIATHRIRIRYQPGISAKYRIVFGSTRHFNILGAPINWEERNIYLDMICSEDV